MYNDKTTQRRRHAQNSSNVKKEYDDGIKPGPVDKWKCKFKKPVVEWLLCRGKV